MFKDSMVPKGHSVIGDEEFLNKADMLPGVCLR